MGDSLVILGVAVSPIAQKVNIISGIVGRCLSFMKQLPLGTAMDKQIFLCRTVDEQAIYQNAKQTQTDWRKWQAQYFASCLLMPRLKIEEARKGRNLLNWGHLNAIREELGVSKRNLVHRLKDLELIQESGNRLYPGKKLKSGVPLLEAWEESSAIESSQNNRE